MSCYAECTYYEAANETMRRVLLRFRDKYERDYVVARFIDTALPSERIRVLTREQARRDYDLNRFGRYPYDDVFLMANPDRPGTNLGIDCIEPTDVYAERQEAWQRGRGTGVQQTLFIEGA